MSGETKPKAVDILSPNKTNNVIRIAEVSNPTVDVYLPDESKNNGAGVVICPGGGFQILAIDLEGSEIAYDVSFNDVIHFRTVFQKHFGCSPGKYRKKLLEARLTKIEKRLKWGFLSISTKYCLVQST